MDTQPKKLLAFLPELVDAIHDGRKTMTMRPLRPQPERHGCGECEYYTWDNASTHEGELEWLCPYGCDGTIHEIPGGAVQIEEVDVGRIRSVDPSVYLSCGIEMRGWSQEAPFYAEWDYQQLWNKCYDEPELAWSENPWVWIITFRKVDL